LEIQELLPEIAPALMRLLWVARFQCSSLSN